MSSMVPSERCVGGYCGGMVFLRKAEAAVPAYPQSENICGEADGTGSDSGIVLMGIGILVGLYLPILGAQFVAPEKIRVYAIIGAILVVAGTALQIVSVWPPVDTDAEQTAPDQD